MNFTPREYAEAAAQANELGKILTIVDGNLVLQDPPEPDPMKPDRLAEIHARLEEIDFASVRPLRSITAGNAEPFDKLKLAELEGEANMLRAELAELLKGD